MSLTYRNAAFPNTHQNTHLSHHLQGEVTTGIEGSRTRGAKCIQYLSQVRPAQQ